MHRRREEGRKEVKVERRKRGRKIETGRKGKGREKGCIVLFQIKHLTEVAPNNTKQVD